MGRILLVANRLPVTIKVVGGELQVERSTGGVATGLAGPHERSGGKWIGWPGALPSGLDEGLRAELDARLAALKTVPLYLSEQEVTDYYEGFANEALWPLFHYLLDKVQLQAEQFATYRHVNERYADLVVEHYEPGDLIWIQDYQLLLLPAMVRERLPDARIGFFLHIPFPSSEVFRLLPWREQVLNGLLGADLVGFHTLSYTRNFSTSLLRLLGLEAHVDRVEHDGRVVQLGAYPMGIDAADFSARAAGPEVTAAAHDLREANRGVKLLLGVDRLDYTKGVPRRFQMIEQMLVDDPALVGRIKLVQVAVPSRTGIPAYEAFRRQVDELVGRINGRFATPDWVPIHYIYRGLESVELVGLYRAADVMLVTPIRDGMNLVAKEFVASRIDEAGVLVLSELAGAADELGEAVRVNPYDVDATARAIRDALDMPLGDQRRRMQAMRRTVATYDVHHWASRFLSELERVHGGGLTGTSAGGITRPAVVDQLVADLRAAPRIATILDYDGTLVPFHGDPTLAAPDEALMTLLGRLADSPRIEVHLVSGRRRADLEGWFGALPVGLHAEHGLMSRFAPGEDWRPLVETSTAWKADVRAIFEQFTSRTPGSQIEEKTASMAWHYRRCDAELGAQRSKELRLHLAETLWNLPVEVLQGNKVIEVRPHGVHKGAVVSRIAGRSPDARLAVMGDDRTDEDMFAAAPPEAITILVGARKSRARYRLKDPAAARAFLERLVTAERSRGSR